MSNEKGGAGEALNNQTTVKPFSWNSENKTELNVVVQRDRERERELGSVCSESPQACQITSPFNSKLCCFRKFNEKECFTEQPIFLLKGDVIGMASQ